MSTLKHSLRDYGMTISLVVIMALFLFSVDTLLAWIVKMVTGRGQG